MTLAALLNESWAAVAALGFAMLFNVPVRALPACCTLAVIGHASRFALIHAGVDLVSATLLAALLVGFLAQGWARKSQRISVIYAISAAIPMVPGVSMYHAVQALLHLATAQSVNTAASEAWLVDAGINATRAAMVVLSLTLGIAAPRLLWPRAHKKD